MSSPGPDDPGPDNGSVPPSRSGDAPEPTLPPTPGATPTSPPPPSRPGASTFTIEGRAAPALFVVGWLASILGIGTLVIAAMATGGAPIVLVAGLVLLSIGLVAGAGSQGIERRARGGLPYLGPSPLLVFVAAIPVSLVALVIVAVPLVALGVPIDGPAGQLASVVVQTLVYVGLIRLLVVDTQALSWSDMGLTRLNGRAVVEAAGGALWALPVIVITIPISYVVVGIFQVTPESPLPPTGETTGFILAVHRGRDHRAVRRGAAASAASRRPPGSGRSVRRVASSRRR